MAVKRRGRKRKIGEREKNGRLKREPVPVGGTDDLKAQKIAITRSDRMELTPLGILAGHGLITEAMYKVADLFRGAHLAVTGLVGRPDMPLPFLAKLPSIAWPDDTEEALRRQENSRYRDEVSLKENYQAMRDKLTLAQEEIVMTLAVFGEWPPLLAGCAHEIISHRLQWSDEFGLVSGPPPSPTLRKGIAGVRAALDALSASKKKTVAAISDIGYCQK